MAFCKSFPHKMLIKEDCSKSNFENYTAWRLKIKDDRINQNDKIKLFFWPRNGKIDNVYTFLNTYAGEGFI